MNEHEIDKCQRDSMWICETSELSLYLICYFRVQLSVMLRENNFSASSPKLEERTLVHKRIADFDDLQSDYKVGNVIGKGNFGIVMEAKDKKSGVYWAIKIVNKRQAGVDRIVLIEREIHILKLVNHPHIIFLDRIFESPKMIYLVFELCIGSLAKEIKTKKQFNERETMDIIKKLSSALSYLHKNDIVHRDLKLENILITGNPFDPDDQLYIKVTDFGLSAVRNGPGRDDMLHDFYGTLIYMAPEIVRTKSYSQQCDVWSMGIIMYVLLSGKFPFSSGNEQHLCKLIITGDPDFSGLSCSQEAKHLLSKFLDKNPAFRITAAEVKHHPWISGSSSELNVESSNVLEMMRLWRNELSTRAHEDGNLVTAECSKTTQVIENEDDTLPQSISSLSIRTNSPTPKFFIQKQQDSPEVIDRLNTCENSWYRRRLSCTVPDYSYVPAKVDTNLPNLRKEAQGRTMKSRRLSTICEKSVTNKSDPKDADRYRRPSYE